MNPLVSVCCLTYNQEKLIRSAMSGFVMQRTNFPYEIIILDDASTDSTPDILKEYREKYDHVRIVTLPENVIIKYGYYPSVFNYADVNGKYIACCDGDDYWTDPMKLQRQADFLEANPDYSMCYHDFIYHWVDRDRWQKVDGYRDYTADELVAYSMDGPIHTNTVMFRNIDDFYKNNDSIDWELIVAMGTHGACKYIPGLKPSVYRRVKGQNSWGSLSQEEKIRFREKHARNIYEHIKEKNNPAWTAMREKYLDDVGRAPLSTPICGLIGDQSLQ